ncbi:mitogen-activated protein kinase kinase kinase 20 [Euphorbia lathyris]|uniref:mitogen-activated protein kinase kinase kinase 20 n=1 Tax=Euphorbia lathyris TaxID=212925 RepID=UPI0033142E29
MDWVRGDSIGCGSFSTVNLAIPRNRSAPLMAVKSSDLFDSVQLENEIDVLNQLQSCDNVIRCFGGDQTLEHGERLFNLLLEYAPGGSLAQLVQNCGGVPESDVKSYTKSVLKGLRYIHAKGFAHCDIKLQNLLLFENGEVKIADFGLAKKLGEKQGRLEFRGTPLYMSPESVNENEYESPCDIWALGCAVVEMITGKSAWNCKGDMNMATLLIKIGVGDELPEIPKQLSEDGKDFVSKCFIKNPKLRWTADMLLDHPFVSNVTTTATTTVTLKNSEDSVFSSPRCPFEFQEWISVPSSSPKSELWSRREELSSSSRIDWSAISCSPSPAERIRELSCDDQSCGWSYSGSWITVR